MSFNIAVAGKGGTGKTSITSLIIRYLMKDGRGPILVVDADANANLGESLGFGIKQTVGSVIASFNDVKLNIPPGMTKEAYLEVRLNETIVESKGIDLITMGRGEGAECYCYPNTLLRKFVDTMSGSYPYMIMDNEAGMEHLSRRTTQNIDELFLVSDHSVKGIRTIARIRDLVSELRLAVKRQSVIINFVPASIDPLVSEELDRLGIVPAATIPLDEAVRRCDLEQKSLLDLTDMSGAVTAINDLMDRLLSKTGAST
ncbi:AAA family ATPase [Chloroflexota bacterium]